MKPKLFKYRLNNENLAQKYEFATTELNQEHTILTDYNMGMRIDLIDREVWSLQPQSAFYKPERSNKDVAEMLWRQELNEKDRFVISDKETLPFVNIQDHLANQTKVEHDKLVAKQRAQQ